MFASASHEFRTPLNAIINSFDFLDSYIKTIIQISESKKLSRTEIDKIDQCKEKGGKFISIGRNSSVLLLALIDDILDLSKMEAGTFKINISKFKISPMLDDICNIFQYQCEQKKLDFNLNVEQKAKRIILKSDEGRIKQVLLNLISNSLKFTFKGFITLSCKSIIFENQEYVKFTVRDSGLGIKKEDQEKLFKMFGTISEDSSLNPKGTGIGLVM